MYIVAEIKIKISFSNIFPKKLMQIILKYMK